MPQGVIIAITPIGSDKKKPEECEGKVKVLDSGEVLPFKQSNCCHKKPGDTVKIDILEGGKGDGRRARVKC